MGIFSGLVLWVEWVIMSYGLAGIFFISILESFIFPVPTVFFIAPTAAVGIDPLLITIIATIGSVIGAIIGYGLGKYLGHPVAQKLFGKHMNAVERQFEKWGAWAVFIAAFTPIPFKVFTWSAGIFSVKFRRFLLAASAGRFLQFIIAAYLGNVFGPGTLIFFAGI